MEPSITGITIEYVVTEISSSDVGAVVYRQSDLLFCVIREDIHVGGVNAIVDHYAVKPRFSDFSHFEGERPVDPL